MLVLVQSFGPSWMHVVMKVMWTLSWWKTQWQYKARLVPFIKRQYIFFTIPWPTQGSLCLKQQNNPTTLCSHHHVYMWKDPSLISTDQMTHFQNASTFLNVHRQTSFWLQCAGVEEMLFSLENDCVANHDKIPHNCAHWNMKSRRGQISNSHLSRDLWILVDGFDYFVSLCFAMTSCKAALDPVKHLENIHYLLSEFQIDFFTSLHDGIVT